ncbi:MAG: SDR family NAD(P)-dependent oxidoreductase [Acidimicrobiia bacterium]|nr:SDR family NAD(P)-dependent oxidoreductase [Acidimicrobiia bacterium]MYG57365.1 SDR family NAD(P)-dependent oxidoreductase [Acidimicrobiia bacterium]MYJ31876.1 SDR family NAD(P)-dependent oxidoreductase [Acidimicrobiia bacterium]
MSSDTPSERLDVNGMVAVVTGGAGGIGKGIVTALLQRGATVVIADIEADTTDATVAELSDLGSVSGWPTDVADEASVAALADHVYEAHGRCNLLFNNAGVTSGGGGKPWEQEPNDWRWCFSVNVFGVAICTTEFVPRMLAGGEPGQIINTSSGDGGFAPVPTASVYAASKAAVSCFTETVHINLIREGSDLRASVLYPSGGMLDTGLFTAQRNRPAHLARVGDSTGRRSMTFQELKDILTEIRGEEPQVADLVEHGNFVVDCVEQRRFIIGRNIEDTVELLHRRAESIGRYDVPDYHDMGL